MTKYKRKSNRAAYRKCDLETAIRRVRNKELTNYAASKLYGIPTSTLNDRVRERTGVKSKTLGRPTTIPIEKEAELANCLRTLEKWGWGLSKEEVLDYVAAFIKRNHIKSVFKNDRPGDTWFIGFRQRHNLSVKKPQTVEYLRRKMTDPFVIHEYFDILQKELTRLNLHDKPQNIWNLDETSVCLDPTKTKVVGAVGEPCTRTTAGGGKENITVLTTVNAAGKKMDPLIVFKGKHVYEQWMAEEHNYDFELAYAASKRGWMETDIFRNYMERVIIPNLNDERPVLMIYDGHVSHVDDRVVDLAVANDITILKLPAHTSHLLQPLDLAVFKSFKSGWDKQLVRWQRENVGSKVRKQAFAEMFAKAWNDTNPEVIRSGFRKGGIHPVNPSVIPKEKFDPSAYRRWQSHIREQEVQQPKTLRQLCLDTINRHISDSSSAINIHTDKRTECSLNSSPHKKTFEDLLLESIQQSKNSGNKPVRRLTKVASGAEVITRTFIEKRQERESQPIQADNQKDYQIPGPSGIATKQQKRSNVLSDKNNTKASYSKKQGNEQEKQRKRKEKQPEKGQDSKNNTEKSDKQQNESDILPTTKKGKGNQFSKGQDSTNNRKHYDQEKESVIQKNTKGKGKGKRSRKGQDIKNKTEILDYYKNEGVIKVMKKEKENVPEPNAKARKGRRCVSIISDTTSDSLEMSVHNDSDIQECISDILSESLTPELPDFFNITNDDIQIDLTREEQIEKIVKEILEDTEGIPEKKQKRENSTKNKVTILQSIPITSETIKDLRTINIKKKDFKVIDTKCNISCTQKTIKTRGRDVPENTYDIGDTILTRYFMKNKWKYFVGVLENKSKGRYTISYYKTVHKQRSLTFVKPKRKDIDAVPKDNIVKAIKLKQTGENPAQYVLMNEEEDSIFF